MKDRFNISIVLIVFLLGLVACSGSLSEKRSNTILSRDFQGDMWNRFDFLEASFNVENAPMNVDLVMELDVNDVYPSDYPYHGDDGLFTMTLSIDSPSGGQRSREFNFHLKDTEGKFKSENIDGYYHFTLPLIDGQSFNENGEYHFRVENKYSKDPLCGIKRLSIICLEKEK